MKKKIIVTLIAGLILSNSMIAYAAPTKEKVEKESQYEKVTLYANNAVNVRDLPHISGNIIRVLEKGDKVTVIALYDGWYETKKHNYIKAEYLSEEKPPEEIFSVTKEERYWLYQLTYAEAGTESYTCRKYIASVVFNLRADSRFPNTITEVIFNGNAFSPTLDGSIYKKVPDASTKAAVDEVIKYGPVTSALYFEATYCHSAWHAQQTFVGQVDDVLFYK